MEVLGMEDSEDSMSTAASKGALNMIESLIQASK